MKKTYNIIAFILCMTFVSSVLASAPNFTLNTLKGNGSVSLSSFRGKVVLVDFWASWCDPCKYSFPAYNQLLQRYGKEGFVILGINQDKESGKAFAFLEHVPAQFTILADPQSVAYDLYNPPTMPTSFLIDREGKLVKTYKGFRPGDEVQIEQDIKNYLAAKEKPSE